LLLLLIVLAGLIIGAGVPAPGPAFVIGALASGALGFVAAQQVVFEANQALAGTVGAAAYGAGFLSGHYGREWIKNRQ
jgi:hypothetical protein